MVTGTPSSPWQSDGDAIGVGALRRKRRARNEGNAGVCSGKTRAGDHAPAEQALLSDAKVIYWATLGAINPYAEDEVREDFVEDALEEASKLRRTEVTVRDSHRKYVRTLQHSSIRY
jgi:hypothetical protein